ncbi:bile acid:sodium symporter family protein [Temperatibacter marinus]|uniref:Bile acid:sodium symporter family protein n=1 Tax=Temperatibacter marinus TaxID=1456591 RepID=A0AA52EJB7_9PROT|nr:bile acid:sodium symporter family protein [Temperatibacter marinus]WND03559.1 bile acid:sodium symporter family protein [Temperatibacter marinus]
MSEANILFVNTQLIPFGLMLIMLSLGMSLTVQDFKNIALSPKAAFIGLAGQFFLLPALAFAICLLFQLPPPLATGLMILAACPGGITSNALVFAARSDVALSVSMTTISSFVTVFTTPLLASFALWYFYNQGAAPDMSFIKTMKKIFLLTILPVVTGMLIKQLAGTLADRLVVWLRPTSMIILILIIIYSTYVSKDRVLSNIETAGFAILMMNVLALGLGTFIAIKAQLGPKQITTIGIEIGVQNATMATVLILAILEDVSLAIMPTLYGVWMLVSASIYIRLRQKHT